MSRTPLIVSGFVLVAAVAAGGGYWYAKSGIAPANEAAAAAQDSSGRKILYWFDPMVPLQHFDKPGKSPFMDMQLVAKYADEPGGEGTVLIDPRVAQNLGVRTAAATQGSVERRVDAVGRGALNRRAGFLPHARPGGFLEILSDRADANTVAKGHALHRQL